MLRTAFVLMLGLAGLSALGFTAFEVTRDGCCCHAPCEGLPLPPALPPALSPAPIAAQLELVRPDVSVPVWASDALAPALAPAIQPACAPSSRPACCLASPTIGDKRAQLALAQQKSLPARTAEQKRAQAKIAATKAAALGSSDPALLAKYAQQDPTAALVPAQPSTKGLAPAALKQPPVK